MAGMQGLRRGRGIRAAWVAAALLPLLGPAAIAQQDPDRSYATQPFTPKDFKMPDGEGCAGDVARWRAVQDNDYASGNIGLKIYHQIAGEIERADVACRAGRDAEASRLVHDSRRRHGYPG